MAGEAFITFMGYTPDPAGAEAFVASLPHPTLAEAGPDLQDGFNQLPQIHRSA